MGYYTDFIIECHDNDCYQTMLEEFSYDDHKDNQIIIPYRKWYEHEEELCAFSTRFPAVLITVTGYGEENDDIWRKYFKNGKVQMEFAEMTFESFDESKLRDPKIL